MKFKNLEVRAGFHDSLLQRSYVEPLGNKCVSDCYGATLLSNSNIQNDDIDDESMLTRPFTECRIVCSNPENHTLSINSLN